MSTRLLLVDAEHRRVGDDTFLAEQLAMIWRDKGWTVYLDRQRGLDTQGGVERQDGLEIENGLSREGRLGEGVGEEGEGMLEVYNVSRGDVYDANGISQRGIYDGSLLEGSQQSSPGSTRGSVEDMDSLGGVSRGSQEGLRLENFSRGSLEGARLDGLTVNGSGFVSGSGGGGGGGGGIINPGGGDSISQRSGDAIEVALYPGVHSSAFSPVGGVIGGNHSPGGGYQGSSLGGGCGSGGGSTKKARPKHPPKTIGPLVLAQGQGLGLISEQGSTSGQGSTLVPTPEPVPEPGLAPEPEPGLTRHEALAQSRVCVCLLSRQAINSDGGAAASLTALPGPYAPSYSLFTPDSPCDELLLEHRCAHSTHTTPFIHLLYTCYTPCLPLLSTPLDSTIKWIYPINLY